MSTLVNQLTIEPAHKEFNSLVDNISAKFQQLAGADPGFGQGGAPASAAESCQRSEAESRERSKQYAAGVQGP